MSISIFNLFSPKNELDYYDVRLRLQGIIFNVELRLRAILVNVNKDLNKTDIDRISWTQKLLHRELVG